MLLHRSPAPILPADRPWEENAMIYAVAALAHPDGDIALYYSVRRGQWHEGNVLCLARSTDGHTWTKPDLGDGTNIVMRGSGHEMDWGEFMPTSIIYEPADPDPAQRWKMTYWDRPAPDHPPGICLAASADGLTWRPGRDRPIITNANDAMSLVAAPPDDTLPLGQATHFIYQQTWKYNPALSTQRDNLKGMHRRISIWKGEGFDGRWVGPVTVLEPQVADAPDLQFYALSTHPLPHGGYGGWLNCHHTDSQVMDVQWVRSRDGWTWTRELDRTPLLGVGQRGNFDCGMVMALASPVRRADRVLVFYNGRATVHDHQARYPEDPLPSPAQGIGLAEFCLELLESPPAH